jgi:CheY-like chemotaxis protein
LAKNLLAFSRRLKPNARPMNLNNEIIRVRRMLERTMPRMIKIEIVLADDLATINADPGQMEQILLNLAVNAQHAMPEGGRLTVETTNVILDEEYCRTQVDSEPGKYVLLTVSDTGQGMEKEVVDRIFEPFFTTKKPGEGTGLGLAMVFGIVKNHKGNVTCDSQLGVGSVFKIYLPAVVTKIEPDVGETRQMPAFGTETILLVDDDAAIRKLGDQILKMSGYSVMSAADGREACALYRAHRKEIALVLLDLIMPEMGGKQCLEELLAGDPDVKVIIASGYAIDGPTKEALEAGAKGFISKPYDTKELLTKIRNVLDAG